VFEIQESHIRKIHCKAETTPRARHQMLAFDSDEQNAVMRLIEAGHANRDFVLFIAVTGTGHHLISLPGGQRSAALISRLRNAPHNVRCVGDYLQL
jgi:hypothetical protein